MCPNSWKNVNQNMSFLLCLPVITDFTDEQGNDCMKDKVQENYNRIKEEVKQIVKDELERIASDESLKHLLQNK